MTSYNESTARLDELVDRENARIAQLAAAARGVPPHGALDTRVELIDASAVVPQAVRWLWPGWLARGKLHIVAGAPGTGKTTLAVALAANVTAATPFPDGWKPQAPGNVLVWSGEDVIDDTLLPRMLAAGANLTRVKFVGDVRTGGDRYAFDPARDVPLLAAALANVQDVRLIVIDPLVSAVAGDSHKNAEVRRSLQPLADLAARMDAALLGVTHYTKGTQGREPLERVSGSLAFGAVARLVFGTAKKKVSDDVEGMPPCYVLARVKSNIGPDGGGFAYQIEQTDIDQGISTSRIAWGEAMEGTARALLAEAEADPDDEGQDAATFLHGLLAHGPMPAKSIYHEAEGAGYSRDQMKRAKAKVGVTTTKHGMVGGWAWALRSTDASLASAEGSEERTQNYPHPSRPSGVEPHPSAPTKDAEVFDL